MYILVTGAAGFIGAAVSMRLLGLGYKVVGLDSLNEYYDVGLKYARLDRLRTLPGFVFYKCDISDAEALDGAVGGYVFSHVINLAAQAGVRYSLENPQAYTQSNLVGFANVIELVRKRRTTKLIYASSSSVYGRSLHSVLREDQTLSPPASLYAATKQSNELVAATYVENFGIDCLGLRLFTVYGPWGRPDMALFKFVRAILRGNPIELYNRGELSRDFTFIDDVAEALCRLVELWDGRGSGHPGSDRPAPILNVGGGRPVRLLDFVKIIEDCVGLPAKVTYLDMQPGDVFTTCASTERLNAAIGFVPQTELVIGVEKFVDWYVKNYDV